MSRQVKVVAGLLIAVAGSGGAASWASALSPTRPELTGTVWVANRGASSVRAFDATTGEVVAKVPMRPGSQTGDLAVAKGKVYVSEEFASPPGIAIVDAGTAEVREERLQTGARPHHVHASPGGNLVSYGVFGTNRIGIIDARSDTLIGEWPASDRAEARSHAGVFSPDGRTVYVANDNVSELVAVDSLTGARGPAIPVPNAHELVVTSDGGTAYVSSRSGNRLYVVNLEPPAIVHDLTLELPAPDTLRLSANDKLLTVGLRTRPARVAVIDTDTLGTEEPDVELVTIGTALTTLAGHQWTSPNGDHTFAAFEGPGAGVAVIDHEHDNTVVQTLDYPGAPHGVDFTRLQPFAALPGAAGSASG